MQIKDVMTRQVEVIDPGANVQEAAQRMQELNIGSLPVCDTDKLIGIVTDRDITVRATTGDRDQMHVAVREVMTPHVQYCFEDEDVHEAARRMGQLQIRRMAVLTRDKRLVGMITLGDLADHTGDQDLAGEVLQQVSHPAEPHRVERHSPG